MCSEDTVSLGLCLSTNDKINCDDYSEQLSEMKDLSKKSPRYPYTVDYHLAHKHTEDTKGAIFYYFCFCSRKWLEAKEEKVDLVYFSDKGKKKKCFLVNTFKFKFNHSR